MIAEAYPKRTPPKATNMPMMIAGAADPATLSGFLSMRPMMEEVEVEAVLRTRRNQTVIKRIRLLSPVGRRARTEKEKRSYEVERRWALLLYCVTASHYTVDIICHDSRSGSHWRWHKWKPFQGLVCQPLSFERAYYSVPTKLEHGSAFCEAPLPAKASCHRATCGEV